MNAFTTALLAGLSMRPRALSPKWFYDLEGSHLFERICALPEYYPTRTETALLGTLAPVIAEHIGANAEIIEPGAGAVTKVRLLLEAMEAPAGYVPVDISGEFLSDAAEALRAAMPALCVRPLVADFTAELTLPAPLGTGRRVGFYPGSSIGNFAPDEAVQLLRRFSHWLQVPSLAADAGADQMKRKSAGLLIGVDLVKDPHLLHAAYNDAQGVTAAFNLNLWARANREAGANFRLEDWQHAAFYNAPLQRIEMHLVSRCEQQVRVAGQTFDFAEGESVHTECSYKYTVGGFQKLARAAGWTPAAVWTDDARRFALHWLEADPV